MPTDTHSEFEALAAFAGEPGQFWPRLRAYAQELFQAEGSCLLVQAEGEGVRVLAQSSTRAGQSVVQSGLLSELGNMSDGALHAWSADLWVVSLPTGAGSQLWLVLLDVADEESRAALREVKMLAESYQSRRREQRTGEQVIGLSEALDLGIALGESENFSEAALRLCHRVAALLGAARVSLGWVEDDILRLRATSHGGRIHESTQEAEALVRVMGEAADQNNEAAHPAITGSQAITREHQAFSRDHQGAVVLSIPIRDAIKREPLGVLLLERAVEDGGWREAELECLRLSTDLIASRLSSLHETSGWWGRRLWRGGRRRL
ncbi:MAG: GAF domain-containing protein, partial [Akkermansiaceae bacterium]|nr:GAF domain-containing protein [Akkermansiaceae bacterium]